MVPPSISPCPVVTGISSGNSTVSKDNWHSYKLPPDEQEYSNEVEVGARVEPSQDELANLLRACEKLWDLDLNRLVPGKDYEIDCGEGEKSLPKGRYGTREFVYTMGPSES